MLVTRSGSLAVLVAVSIGASSLLSANTRILPFEEVTPGMRGVGRTVFEGTEITEFQVEILGILPNVAPDQNLILGRCTGGPLAETGVLSGMSGSPVFIDGRLVGAVAYSWGFSKDAIAGITPIEEMLAVARLGEDASGQSPAHGPAGVDDLGRLGSADGLRSFFSNQVESLASRPGAGSPLAVPLAVSGLGTRGLASIAPDLRRAGFVPLQGGSTASGPGDPATIEPGSAVGVKLVRGDIEMTATGTVTWRENDRILAFGHPLFALGNVDLPMTAARVETLLPSLHQSSRIARPLGAVGALRQDRVSAVAGTLGAEPSMIPVRVHYADGSGQTREYAFDIADDPLLAPLLLYFALNGVLASRDRAFGSATLRVAEGSVIKMVGEEDVELDNLFSGPTALAYATGTSAYILHLLLNNDWSTPRVAAVNLLLEYEAAPRTATLRRVTLDRYRVLPGDDVRIGVVLRPYRGPDVALESEISIPQETPRGPLELQVGSALAVSRSESGGHREPILPRDLSQFIWLINHLRRNDRVYIMASSLDDGVFMDGARLPNLPPSVASILARPKSRGNFAVIPNRAILEVELLTDYAVEGLSRIQLEVETP
jgi:hypothetical protein